MKYTLTPKSLIESERRAIDSRMTDDGSLFVDFGKAAFGTLTLAMPGEFNRRSVVVHLGEKLAADGRIDRDPPGTIRYTRIEQTCVPGQTCRLVIPPDERNTGPHAIKMPDYIGEVYPFRYAEIEAGGDFLTPDAVRQIAVHYPFNDEAAAFSSSSPVLNEVWGLCKYSIKATTFCGVYVDGDRERIPYEGDAYINQLSHYSVDHEYDFGRYSHEYMIQRPTWPTEWHLHSVIMAWADYLYTGESISLEAFYEELCAKTLIDFARPDGLICVAPEKRTPEIEKRIAPHVASGLIKENIRDLVDWPPGSFTDGGTGERDNHEMLPFNTVVNAFHCHALKLMSRIAHVLGRQADQSRFARQAAKVKDTLNRLFFDRGKGVYVDGEGAQHASLHSNMFMLAFGLVPDARRQGVVEFVKTRGMACSVYGAQHLLEALYLNGEGQYALELMTARHDRSWWNMLKAGSTITLEAWDLKYKNNLDWNHAWGAAPANIIPRFVLGVRPIQPGFREVIIQPQPGLLEYAKGTVPTPRGPVAVRLATDRGQISELRVDAPTDMVARVVLPRQTDPPAELTVNGTKAEAATNGF